MLLPALAENVCVAELHNILRNMSVTNGVVNTLKREKAMKDGLKDVISDAQVLADHLREVGYDELAEAADEISDDILSFYGNADMDPRKIEHALAIARAGKF